MIHVIGDSHVNLFNGGSKLSVGIPCNFDCLPDFTTYPAGAHLAYNLRVDGYHVNRDLIMKILCRNIPIGSDVLFVFGEIDCRMHVNKQKVRQGRPLDNIVSECAESYVCGIEDLAKDWNFVLWGPHPIWGMPSNMTKYFLRIGDPHVGSYTEVNYSAFLFNLHVERVCRERNIPFATIYYRMMERMWYLESDTYLDRTHLRPQKVLPLALEALAAIGMDVRQTIELLNSEGVHVGQSY